MICSSRGELIRADNNEVNAAETDVRAMGRQIRWETSNQPGFIAKLVPLVLLSGHQTGLFQQIFLNHGPETQRQTRQNLSLCHKAHRCPEQNPQ